MGKRLNIMLYNETTGEQLVLPINPDNIVISHSKSNETFNVLRYGEVNIMGERNLQRISLSHFLPENDTIFGTVSSILTGLKNGQSPFESVYTAQKAIEMLREWEDGKNQIRLIIDRDVNTVFDILSFEETIRESVASRPYNLELIEYRNPAEDKAEQNSITGLLKRRNTINIPNKIVMKAGDTVYDISHKYGVDFKRLAIANGIINVNAEIIGHTLSMVS